MNSTKAWPLWWTKSWLGRPKSAPFGPENPSRRRWSPSSAPRPDGSLESWVAVRTATRVRRSGRMILRRSGSRSVAEPDRKSAGEPGNRSVEKPSSPLFKSFMQAELRELELRKDGQLARLLGEPLPGEAPEALQRLATEDRRQAEEGLVALMSNGKVSYKHVERLCEKDMPARIAAHSLRTTWLKDRGDGWLGRG